MKPSAAVIAASLSVAMAKTQPGCDWTGTILISGTSDKNNQQDYYMTCTDNVLASISNIYAGESSMKPTDDGDVACDWTGPGQIDGLYDCQDFNFECYDGVLYGIKTIESDIACPSIDFAPFGSSLDGVVCNFATSLRTTGENYVAFSFDCQNGTTSYIYYDQSVAKKVDRVTDSAPTCTTWATAAGSWQLLHEHNQDFTYQFTYGTQSTDSDTTSSEWSQSLEESISAGCLFIHDTVTANISHSISQTVSSSLTTDYSATTTVPCSSPNGQNEGGALYQWVMNTQHVDETSTTTTVFSDSTICVPYQGEPKCPVDACADELCQTCNTWNSTSNLTNPGYKIASCDWGSPITMTDNQGNGLTFSCNSNKMDGIAGTGPSNEQGEASSITGDSITSCASCDWTGYKAYYGIAGADCDGSVVECYNGFIYGVTFVGENGKYHASSCRQLVKPFDTPLTGALCNWEDGTDYVLPDANGISNLHLFCNGGIISSFQYSS